LIQEQGVAKEKTLGQDTTIAELTSRIEMIESKFASSTSEKESLINSLHQNLKESEARHAAAKANLESSKAELAESKKEMERMKSIESRLDTLASNSESSFADVKSLLLNVEGTSSRTESLAKTTNELQAEANVATSSWLAKGQVFDNMIEGNERLQAKVTELSCQSSEIHQSFSAMQRDVAATNESLVKLERLSYRIKGSLSDVQIGLSAASTNDVIIARLESRSAHNEEMLLNIQQGLERTLLKANIDAVEKQTNLTLSTLQESLNGMQKQNEALEKIQESLAQMRGLRHQKSDPATAEALNRLGDRTHEISDTLTSIHALLKVPANNPHTPSSSQIPNQESYATETHSSSTNDDTPIDESNLDNQSNASALAANDLIANCVSEAISAMSPSKILVTN
jgi:predicted nuclease with TOPRIM domain